MAKLLERFENLSMIPGSPNFIETEVSRSQQIQVKVASNTNGDAEKGTSLGSGAPDVPISVAQPDKAKTKFRINVNGDGYHKVDLQTALGDGNGQVKNLDNPDNVRKAIQYVVRQLTPHLSSTVPAAFSAFTCTLDNGKLLLRSGASVRSGTTGRASSVTVAPASNPDQDASKLLKLGRRNLGIKTMGVAVTQPQVNPKISPGSQIPALYLIGKNNALGRVFKL